MDEQKLEEEKLKERILQRGNLPQHIAIIMDGNGRWARSRQLPRVEGHREGINSVREVVRVCGELNIKYLTLYTFSTENWRRPRSEVTALMRLLIRTVRSEVNELQKNNVRLITIGNLQDLPSPARRAMIRAMELLKDNTGLTLCLALSYSSRREITDAVKKIVQEALEGKIKIDEINDQVISNHLYTASIPDPDLLIRTSGEMRVSNFLLWQLAYTEIYVTDVFWPDFRRLELLKAVESYQKRERRYGMVSEQLAKTRVAATI
ncbi:MAG: isoprenyl transferase [Calditrichaeota bacterium]|nr:MAG: isoprenyl transferase [Calditrichota bacterium]